MKRSIPRSLLQQPPSPRPEAPGSPSPAPTGAAGGAGSAWKAGALAQSQAAVAESRERMVHDILHGRHELSLDPDQVHDPLGSDRRADWIEQGAFQALLESIAANGQDTPILVWPEDPDWAPDPLAPAEVTGVRFLLLTGRRRHAAAARLGRPLRAILAPPSQRGTDMARFEMLFLRFRENEARENLSPFERLSSIGEMYATLQETGQQMTAVAFAERIGVHESLVSRARSVFAAREEILNRFKNAYDMTFRELQGALADLKGSDAAPAPTKTFAKAPALTAKRKIGPQTLSLKMGKDGLSVTAKGLSLDQSQLDDLSTLIADYIANLPRAPEG